MRTSSPVEPLLALLQLSDSAIPIGGYSHSFGLETFVQQNIITDLSSAEGTIRQLLSRSIAPQDGIACGCAFRCYLSWHARESGEGESGKSVESAELAKLMRLHQFLSASKWSKEIHQASIRMGSRLLKLARETGFINSHLVQTSELHHSVVFGWLAASSGSTELSTVAAYLQNSVNCLISACVRLIPLGHTDGQRILVALRPLIAELSQQYAQCEIEQINSFAPLAEAASFAHESLYSRLFQS